MARHKELIVWQKAMDLVDSVYAVTRSFPKEALFALTSQMRRSAVSVASNIAEGAARNGKKEFLQFIGIAQGSLAELETQVIVACRQSLITDEQGKRMEGMIEEIGRLLARLSQSLKRAA